MSSNDTVSNDSGHTLRRSNNYYLNEKRYTLGRYPSSLVGYTSHLGNYTYNIPITEVDYLLSYRDLNFFNTGPYCGKSYSLNKRELFNDVIEACDEFATEKKVTYDKKTGLDKVEYVVPIIDIVNTAKIPYAEDYYDPIPCPKKNCPCSKPLQQTKKNKKRSYRYYEAQKKAKSEQFVVIDGNRYNFNYIYKRQACGFVPFVMHPEEEIELTRDEVTLRSSTVSSKTSITISLPNDSKVTSLILQAEPMKISNHYANFQTQQRRRCRSRNYIRVLENDPKYITKFKLLYRSAVTYGKWIEHGIYDGNTSIFDATKIEFAEIVAKELRIIPLTHTGSFDKVRVTPLTPRTTFVDDAEETDVTYTMYLPHGKPRKSYSYEMDTYVGCSYRCDCLRCRNPKKGMKKEWNRDLALNFSEGYDD